MGAQSLNPSFEGKKVKSKKSQDLLDVESMLVQEEVQAEEKAVEDVQLDFSSREASVGHVSDAASDVSESSEELSNSASEVEDDYTEAFKSLSLKAASVSSTPAKATAIDESSISNADNPKKESEEIISKQENENLNDSSFESSSEKDNSSAEEKEPIKSCAKEENACCRKESACSTGSCCEKPKTQKPPCCQGGSCTKKPAVVPNPQTNAEDKRSCSVM